MDIGSYFPFWKQLSLEERDLLSASVRQKSFERETVLHNGDADCIGLLVILTGQLRVYTVSPEGKEITLYRLYERDICLLSASCVFRNIQFEVCVSALQQTHVLQVPADVYRRLDETSLPVARYTGDLMASRLSDVMWLLDQVLNQKNDRRLAALLLEEYSDSQSRILSVTHEQLARHLGSAREVITRLLKYFVQEGLIRLSRGKIELLDLERLLLRARSGSEQTDSL